MRCNVWKGNFYLFFNHNVGFFFLPILAISVTFFGEGTFAHLNGTPRPAKRVHLSRPITNMHILPVSSANHVYRMKITMLPVADFSCRFTLVAWKDQEVVVNDLLLLT